MRATRDLLRRRLHFVRKRGQLLAHIQNTIHPYNLDPFGKRIAYPANRDGLLEHFPDPAVRKSIEVDLALRERLDALIADLELTIVRHAKRHDADAFHRLRSVPGIGKILGLTILYEIHDVTRFDRVQQFVSYARLVKCAHESAGKPRQRRRQAGRRPLEVGLLRSRRVSPAPRRRRQETSRPEQHGGGASTAHKIGRRWPPRAGHGVPAREVRTYEPSVGLPPTRDRNCFTIAADLSSIRQPRLTEPARAP
jgi:transposase